MQKKAHIFYQMIAIIGVLAFFTPWLSFNNTNLKGYELTAICEVLSINTFWGAYLLPLVFTTVFILHTQRIRKVSGTIIKLFELTPILLILIMVTNLFLNADFVSFHEKTAKQMSSELGIGVYLTLLTSVIIVFTPIKKRK